MRAARPHGVAAGEDGCWFSEWSATRVEHIGWTSDIGEVGLPSSTPEPHGIAVGPDSAAWVALASNAGLRLGPGDDRCQILRTRASQAGSSTRDPTASPSSAACSSVTTPR